MDFCPVKIGFLQATFFLQVCGALQKVCCGCDCSWENGSALSKRDVKLPYILMHPPHLLPFITLSKTIKWHFQTHLFNVKWNYCLNFLLLFPTIVPQPWNFPPIIASTLYGHRCNINQISHRMNANIPTHLGSGEIRPTSFI